MTQPYETSAIDTATMNDLIKRVAELEERLQTHTGDAQGSAGQFYPHPIQMVDTAEFGGGIMRLDNNGLQVLTQIPLTTAIWFVSSGFKGKPDVGQGYGVGQVYSLASNSQPLIALRVVDSNGNSNKIQVLTDTAGTNETISIDAPLVLANYATEPSTAEPGKVLYKTGTNKYRVYDGGTSAWENLVTETYLAVHGGWSQSSSAAAVATNGTITTAGVSVARVAPTGAVTGVILAVGTTGGQVCTVVNEAVAANTVTFAASGTSHVADGTSSVIAGLNARRFVWDSGTSLWYPCK